MNHKAKDMERVGDLDPGGSCEVNWFQDGGGVILRIGDKLLLYEVPQFGGEEFFVKEVDFCGAGIKELVDLAYSWT